jgi:adenosylcobinamide hydrolase
MKQFDLVGKGTQLIFKDSILAVLSETPLTTVSSAFHNGGFQTTKVILNAQVPQNYNDHNLHQDPETFIQECFQKLALENHWDGFVGMVTFAVVKEFSLVSKREGKLGVSVAVTGGCTHAETAGEKTGPQPVAGTINIIVLIDGNPTESCMISSIITATEAKTAALKELDVRSLYSGDGATGTPTDAIVVAKTGVGDKVIYSGPSSELGQLIGYCTKQAVKEAIAKAPIGGYPLSRPLKARFAERHLSLEKIAAELAKTGCLCSDEKVIAAKLEELIAKDAVFASMLLAASQLSEEFQHNRNPKGFDEAVLGQKFGQLLNPQTTPKVDCDEGDLPVFLKQALIAMLQGKL